jgi:hypothetical protein
MLDGLLVSELGQPDNGGQSAYLARLLRRYAEFYLERPLRSLETPAAQ